jgi:hypothetical protein
MIAAYYQAYKKPQCVSFVLKNFRKHYPNSTVILISDGGDNFQTLADSYNCVYFYENNLSPDNLISMGLSGNYFKHYSILISFVNRIKKALSLIDEKYFMILEDDVYVLKQTNILKLTHDMNGSNPQESLPSSVCNFLNKQFPIPYSGCGGCILNTQFFKTILTDENITNGIIEYCNTTNERWASDSILSYLCIRHGGTIGDWDGFGEYWEPNIKEELNNNTIEVLHQYKVFY